MSTAITALAPSHAATRAGTAPARPGQAAGLDFATLFALGLDADPGFAALPLPGGESEPAQDPAALLPLDVAQLAAWPPAPEFLARLESLMGQGKAVDAEGADATGLELAAADAAPLVSDVLPGLPLITAPPPAAAPAAVVPAPTPGLAAADGTAPGQLPTAAQGAPFTVAARADGATAMPAPDAAVQADRAAAIPTVATAAQAAVSADAAPAPAYSLSPAPRAAETPATVTAPEAPAPAALQTQVPPARPAGDIVQLRIATPVSHPAWAGEVDQKLTWMVGNARHEAELVINPPQLGRIEVSLVVQGDQVSASFASPHQAVREALETALVRLRESLAESGIQLGEAHVGHEARRDSQADSPRQGMRQAAAEAAAAGSMHHSETRWQPLAARGLVDVFA